jgi:surface polysaccharide O-acyltransferase-like enzyme
VFREVQNLRAIAILAVILIHVTATFTAVGSLTYVTGTALVLDTAVQFAVPLFIFISGFVLTIKNYPLSTFYFKRGSRILPAYLLFSVIYAAYFHHPILESILNANGSYHLPFFAAIFGFYLFYPVIMRLYFGKITLLVSLLIQLYFWQIPYAFWLQKLPIWLYYWTWTIFYFVLGIYVCKNYAKFQKTLDSLPMIWLILPALALWSLMALRWLNIYYGVRFIQTVSLNPLIDPALYVIQFGIAYKITTREISQVLKNVGEYSFGIYLIHVLILGEIVKVLSQYNVDCTNFIFYIILFIFTFFISYVVVSMWDRVRELLKTTNDRSHRYF